MSDALNQRLTNLRRASVPPPRNGRLKVNRIVGPEAYYMGIVDFQQLYNLSKQAERFIKIHVKGDSPEGLSCLEPVAYRQRYLPPPSRPSPRIRFLRRMEDLLDLEDSGGSSSQLV